MSLPYFIRAGRLTLNPRHIVMIDDRTRSPELRKGAEAPGATEIVVTVVYGITVELSGDDAAAVRRVLDRLWPAEPEPEARPDELPVVATAKARGKPRSGDGSRPRIRPAVAAPDVGQRVDPE